MLRPDGSNAPELTNPAGSGAEGVSQPSPSRPACALERGLFALAQIENEIAPIG